MPEDFTPRIIHNPTTVQATSNATAPNVWGVPKSSNLSLFPNSNLLNYEKILFLKKFIHFNHLSHKKNCSAAVARSVELIGTHPYIDIF